MRNKRKCKKKEEQKRKRQEKKIEKQPLEYTIEQMKNEF